MCLEEGDLTESPRLSPVEIEVSLKDFLLFCALPAPYLDEKLSDCCVGLLLNIVATAQGLRLSNLISPHRKLSSSPRKEDDGGQAILLLLVD